MNRKISQYSQLSINRWEMILSNSWYFFSISPFGDPVFHRRIEPPVEQAIEEFDQVRIFRYRFQMIAL